MTGIWNSKKHLVQPLRKKLSEVWEREGFSSQSEYEKFMWKKQMLENGYENLIPAGY